MNDAALPARTKLTLAIAAAGGVFTLSLMLYASQPWSADGGGGSTALLLIPFALAALSPYVLVAWIATRASARDGFQSWVLLILAILITVPAAWIYVLGFIVEPDAQSGLLFVFIPVYQYLAGAVVLMLSAIARGVFRTR